MKTAIIIHGRPEKEEYYDPQAASPSNSHWLPWIQKQLLLKDILAQTPEMPVPYLPDYSEWKKTFEQFAIDSDTILIGHSRGGCFIVRYLSENNITVGKVVLVAPSLGIHDDGIIDFTLDENIVSKTKGITIFSSTNDMKSIQVSIALMKEKIKDVKVIEFKVMGHFCYEDMKTDAFPELLEEALK